MSLRTIWLHCEDMERAGVRDDTYGCCTSCHEDQDYGYGDTPQLEPPPNAHGRESRCVADVCCAYCRPGGPPLTRADFAKMLIAKRAELREPR